jgi:uncharacterized protein YqiB (DUF1249 family)|tara:strand:- start:95 stop:550 length:456 start_codon:yes stop_codon:yes gene_type:complete
MIKNKINKYKRSNRGLNQLLRLYERNYLKLIHFFPIGDHESSIVYLMPEGLLNKEIRISCKKLSSHTSVIEIYKSKSLSLLENTEIEIYIYHDARMAEVRKFNGKKQFWLRNKYPNKNMLSKDEKFQWNFFLEEFLTHTKTHGLSILKDAL